jgi:hypothetical protein
MAKGPVLVKDLNNSEKILKICVWLQACMANGLITVNVQIKEILRNGGWPKAGIRKMKL